MLRVLTFSTLYPNSVDPVHGIFVETRLRHLLKTSQVEAKVVAPVPWFPSKSNKFGSYGKFAKVPRHEVLHGIQIDHPRYVVLPKIGMSMSPFALAWSGHAAIRAVQESGWDFDIIDAHYFYPDGVAAAMIGRYLKKPVVITARGSDLNLIPEYRVPRALIRKAAASVTAIITVSEALKDRAVQLGLQEDKLHVLRNGVDLEFFQPVGNREIERNRHGMDKPTVLSVGNLVKNKGHDIVIRALKELGDAELIIIGSGPEEKSLKSLVMRLGLDRRVRFLGRVAHEELASWYYGADVLTLASTREGWPNVVLESLACGTPVVATSVGGIPEIVREDIAGVLIERLTPQEVARGVKAVLHTARQTEKVRHYASRFTWAETTGRQLALFSHILSASPA